MLVSGRTADMTRLRIRDKICRRKTATGCKKTWASPGLVSPAMLPALGTHNVVSFKLCRQVNTPVTGSTRKLTVVQRIDKFTAVSGTQRSSPCSQGPTTGPHSEPDESSPHTHTHTPYVFNIHFNIIIPSPPKSSNWPLPLMFSG
jgi:hypothetical protein